jgi:hypothetical protein
MISSTYNPCFLITDRNRPFRVVGIQTDNTLILCADVFTHLEDEELTKANLIAKPKEELTLANQLIFNSCVLTLSHDSTIQLRQKEQGKKLALVAITSPRYK